MTLDLDLAILTFQFAMFAFMWKSNRDARAEFRGEMQELRREFQQFRAEVLAELRELREQVYKLWQHIGHLENAPKRHSRQ